MCGCPASCINGEGACLPTVTKTIGRAAIHRSVPGISFIQFAVDVSYLRLHNRVYSFLIPNRMFSTLHCDCVHVCFVILGVFKHIYGQ